MAEISERTENNEQSSHGDGSKFMDSLKEDKSGGKEFMESLNEEDASKNDTNDSEKTEKKGGSYAEVKKTSDGETSEVHHMPADSVSELPREDGPAIKMDKEDHKQTASYGSSKEAQEYRQEQKELIEQGKFREAIEMDIDDIHEKFGDKYDDAIAEMLEYVDKLEEEGRV